MSQETPSNLAAPSRVLLSANGMYHITDTDLRQGLFYGFFVNVGGAVINTVGLDPKRNFGDLTVLDGVTLAEGTEYIIPGITHIQLTSGSVSAYSE